MQQPTTSAPATAPADPAAAKREITANWRKFFDPKTSLAEKQKVLENGDRMAALAVTAFARPEDRQKALDAGFDDHLPKPVDPDRLLELAAKMATG